MTVVGYILIKVQIGKEHDIQEALSDIKELEERYTIHFVAQSELGFHYDFLVKTSTKDSTELQLFMDNKLMAIKGITDTKVIMGV